MDRLHVCKSNRDRRYHSCVRLLLASASPRRRELLDAAGFAFDVEAVDVDERRHDGETAPRYVERVARLKASVAAARQPGRVILAADTAVVVDADILGKPLDAADAVSMLRRLSGRAHEVVTGVALSRHGTVTSVVESTTVWFDPLSDADITAYVATGEPFDKAGAYAIQGWASRVAYRIDGSYSNVVGLPVAAVARMLRHEE
jgi:septum formation protein